MKEYLSKWAGSLIIIGFAIVIVMGVKRASEPPPVIDLSLDRYANTRVDQSAERRADREKQRAIDKAAQVRRLGVVIVESINTSYNAVADGDYRTADIAYTRALKTLADRIKLTDDVDGMMAKYNTTCDLARARFDHETAQRIAQYDASVRAGVIYQMLRQMQNQ